MPTITLVIDVTAERCSGCRIIMSINITESEACPSRLIDCYAGNLNFTVYK